MTQEEMKDVIHELIVVDTDEEFIVESTATKNTITFTTTQKETFKVTVEKL